VTSTTPAAQAVLTFAVTAHLPTRFVGKLPTDKRTLVLHCAQFRTPMASGGEVSNGLIKGLSDRVPWLAVGKPLLQALDIESSRGWKLSLQNAAARKEWSSVQTSLREALVDHIIAGEKAIQLIRIDRAERQQIAKAVKKLAVENTKLTASYPEPGDSSSFNTNTDTPQLAALVDVPAGLGAVYTAVRKYDQRIELDLTALVKEQRDDYERVFGLRAIKRQTFDTLWLPDGLDYLVLAADHPTDSPRDFSASALTFLRRTAAKLIGEARPPLNLFKAIDQLYKTGGGRVVELGFATDGASTKREKMRQAQRCLRKDLFHQGGSVAVAGNVTPYHISVNWSSVNGKVHTRPELTLHGSAFLLHRANPVLDICFIRNGLGTKDLALGCKKLSRFV
jgi:hypothetical protein